MATIAKVSTTNLVETTKGTQFHPTHVSQSLSPSTGSIQQAPPSATRIVGVDHQLTTVLLTAGAGAFTSVTWPSVGFAGLLSAQQRFFTAGIAPPLTSTIANNSTLIAAGQSTQLYLECNVQSYSTFPNTVILMGQVSFTTLATTTTVVASALAGPWFSTGISYTGFAATPGSTIYTPTAVAGLSLSLGISARLYTVYIQS